MKEALFYVRKEDGDKVVCLLCPQRCVIAPGKTGICRQRRNVDGTLYALNYAEVSSAAIDPVEKKPLYHFYPGHTILSVGTVGCNLHCKFCQNWEIAHGDAPTTTVTPEELVRMAKNEAARGPCIGIAYTYNEPWIWYEYVYDAAVLAHEAGLKNVLVTNGFVEQEPLEKILPYVDAMNIDVKAFTDDYYRKLCAGRLEPVLRTVERAVGRCHVELTTLIVTGCNDSPEEIKELVDWVAGLDPAIPLHFSRYFPRYRMDAPPTPEETLWKARSIALEKLHYVYLGNVHAPEADSTRCPRCRNTVVERLGYLVRAVSLDGNRCGHCGQELNIVGEARVNW
ncbi:MAG: AmmeMemoRadiSam system radical SAM enzyme [Desulfotomaculales bacterium]